MPSDEILVVRGEFSIEDPWLTPAAAVVVRLRRATDGDAPRLSTTVASYYDDEFLNVVFSAADDHIEATLMRHDDPLYEEDAVEVFLAPTGFSEYFEIEVSPRATTFDAAIHSPDGIRETMKADHAWNCEGLFAAVRKVTESGGAMTVETLIRIPFRSLGRSAPEPGEVWRANFFRIDRHTSGDEYSAWRPTLKTPADFHITSAFGQLKFRGE